jgi:hypothetical protein
MIRFQRSCNRFAISSAEVRDTPVMSQGDYRRIEQFFQPDGQLADPYTGRVVDGIGDRRIGADIAELAQTLDAQIVDQVILLADQDHLGLFDVGIDRDQIFDEVGVVVAGTPAIDLGGGRRVDDAAGGERANDARTADLAGPRIACTRISTMKACCIGCNAPPGSASPSIVVTGPRTAMARVRHPSTRTPSTSTVQAPHWPWSQPFFAPVSASLARARYPTLAPPIAAPGLCPAAAETDNPVLFRRAVASAM